MDTELKGNGERPGAADEIITKDAVFYEEEPPKKLVKINSFILLAAGVFMTLFCVMSAADISSYRESQRTPRDMTLLEQIVWNGRGEAYQLREELERYEKNLQRFFIHYDGFEPESFNAVTAATDEEINALKMEHEIIYQQSVREIMDGYDMRIRDAEEALSRYTMESPAASDDSMTFYFEQNGTSIAFTEPFVVEQYNEYARLINERDAQIAAVREKYLLTDKQAAKIIEQNKQQNSVYDVSNYYEIKAYLENTQYFRYCLKNAKTGELITNIPQAEWAGYESPMQYIEKNLEYYISVQDGFFSTMFNDMPLNEAFKGAGLSGYIAIPAQYGSSNPVAAYFTEKLYVDSLYRAFIVIEIIGCVFAAVIWLLFIKSDKSGVARVGVFVKKLYLKLPFIVKAGAFVIALMLLVEGSRTGICYTVYYAGILAAAAPFFLYLAAATAAVLYALICLSHLWDFIRKPSIILNEPEVRMFKSFFGSIGLVYTQHVMSVSLAMSLLVVSYLAVQLAFATILVAGPYVPSELFVIFEVVVNILTVYVFGLIVALAKTNKYMDAIISGDLDVEINERGAYKAVINKLNRLRGGVRRVVVEKNKSDRMKADLITNVSHDLKTPLTSIINYIELLKSPQISDTDKAEFIDILDRKAQRVKHLIDDLFEATKLSSGQITLEKSEINIVNLLKQAVGELEEKFLEADISLKLTYSEDSIPVAADGKKLWRVFENLFTNMIKYSQPGTRAYVDVCERGGAAEIVFKNISYYELNFEYSELFERFKRGDAARSTEGSGLGLSIAKDIVELHDGTMEILIDGDLFKVVIRLAVC